MAEIEIAVEKAHMSYVQPGLWRINLRLMATDESETVIDKDYSAPFRKGDMFDSKSKELIVDMQADIDKYYSERLLYTDKDIDLLVTVVSEGLDLREPTELDVI